MLGSWAKLHRAVATVGSFAPEFRSGSKPKSRSARCRFRVGRVDFATSRPLSTIPDIITSIGTVLPGSSLRPNCTRPAQPRQLRRVRSERSSSERRTAPPHQIRTRNDAIEAHRTRSKSNRSTAKSTKATNILPLITVWLQVRVLPGPPRISVSCLVFVALFTTTAPETAPDTSTFRSCATSRIAIRTRPDRLW